MNVLAWRLGPATPASGSRPRASSPSRPSPAPRARRSRWSRAPTTPPPASPPPTSATRRCTACYTPSALVPEVRRLLADGEPFVYAYYDGVDRVAHARGLGEHYDAELRAADRIVADLLEALPRARCWW